MMVLLWLMAELSITGLSSSASTSGSASVAVVNSKIKNMKGKCQPQILENGEIP